MNWQFKVIPLSFWADTTSFLLTIDQKQSIIAGFLILIHLIRIHYHDYHLCLVDSEGCTFFEENYNVCFLPLLSTWTTWRLQQNIFNAKIIAYHSSSWNCLFTLSFWRWYTCELSSLILEFQSINLWEITLFYCLGMFVVISHPELNYEFGGINCLTIFEHHLYIWNTITQEYKNITPWICET